MSILLGAVLVAIVVLIVLIWLVLDGRMQARPDARRSSWLFLRRWWPVEKQRAEEVLCALLTEAEYGQLRADGYLEVASPTRPGRVYRVPREWGQVLVLDGGIPIEHLCLEPTGRSLPEADMVVLHKLLIQADEEWYLRTANHIRTIVWW